MISILMEMINSEIIIGIINGEKNLMQTNNKTKIISNFLILGNNNPFINSSHLSLNRNRNKFKCNNKLMAIRNNLIQINFPINNNKI
jgi:hypothetical protein